jgi:hypothetical protein
MPKTWNCQPSPHWQHNKPLRCPRRHAMGWLGRRFWICDPCHMIYVETLWARGEAPGSDPTDGPKGAIKMSKSETAGFVYDDGGRKAAGFRGLADDCVTRAIAIAAEIPYITVYGSINNLAVRERTMRGRAGFRAAIGRGSSARQGVFKYTFRPFLKLHGWHWTPTMHIGSGCTVHLRADELPPGRLIVSLSRHLCAVIDGVIHDTSDPSRDGIRCVYGYWRFGA